MLITRARSFILKMHNKRIVAEEGCQASTLSLRQPHHLRQLLN